MKTVPFSSPDDNCRKIAITFIDRIVSVQRIPSWNNTSTSAMGRFITALRLFVLLPALVAAVAGHAQNVPTNEPNFSIAVSTPQEVVKTGADVRLKIVFTNNTGQPLHYATGVPGRGTGPGFDIDLRDNQGKRIPETPYGLKMQGKAAHRPFVGSVFAATVQPGEALVREVMLSKEYGINKPGRYTLRVTESNPNPDRAESNTITLTVTPY